MSNASNQSTHPLQKSSYQKFQDFPHLAVATADKELAMSTTEEKDIPRLVSKAKLENCDEELNTLCEELSADKDEAHHRIAHAIDMIDNGEWHPSKVVAVKKQVFEDLEKARVLESVCGVFDSLYHHGTAAGFLGLLGVDIPKTLDAKAAEEKILPFYNAICRDTAADETRRRTAHTHLKFSIATLGSKAEPRFRAKIARSKANLEGYTVKPKNFDFMMVEHMKLLYQAYCGENGTAWGFLEIILGCDVPRAGVAEGDEDGGGLGGLKFNGPFYRLNDARWNGSASVFKKPAVSTTGAVKSFADIAARLAKLKVDSDEGPEQR